MTQQNNKAILTAICDETARGNGRPFVEALADDVRWTIIGLENLRRAATVRPHKTTCRSTK